MAQGTVCRFLLQAQRMPKKGTSTMPSRLRLISGLAFALTLAACGGTGTATPTATSAGGGGGQTTAPGGGGGGGGATVTDPCTLLTQAEVTAVVGQPVGPGAKDIEPNECDWQYPADGVPSIQASITIETGNTLADLCGPGNSALGLTVTTVGGVGDGACFVQLAGLGAGTNLTFSTHGQVFTVATILGPSATVAAIEAADKALALAALARIG
jgi:hypothetical protein